MDNDFNVAQKFLEQVLPGQAKHTFVFADGQAGTSFETFEKCTLQQITQLLVGKQEDGHVLYVQIAEDIFVTLAGIADVRTETKKAKTLEEALNSAQQARAAKLGEWAPPTAESVEAAKAPKLADAHEKYLKVRGLSDETLGAAGIGSITDKKELARLLKRQSNAVPNALSFPHKLTKDDEKPVVRLQLENPSGGAHGSVWDGGTPVPYYPPQLLEQDAYAQLGTTYVTFDEIDAHVLAQLGFKAVGGDALECFRDWNHFADTGEETAHPSLLSTAQVDQDDVVILYYPRVTGKKRGDALRVARWLSTAGVQKIATLEVKDGNLRKVAFDVLEFNLLSNKQVPVNQEDLQNPYTTLKDVLPADVMADPAFESCKGMYVPHGYDIDPTDGAIYTTKAAGFVNGQQMRQKVLISRTPIVPIAKVVDHETKEISCLLAFHGSTGWTTKHVPLDGIARRAGINQLARWGIAVSDHNNESLVGWLHDIIELNQQHSRFVTVTGYKRTGWHTLPNGQEVFAMPEVTPGVYTFPSLEASGENDLFKGYGKVSGTLEEQLEALRICTRHPAGRLVVTDVFRAMLLPKLDGRTTRCIHLYGESTGGKTLVMIIALNMYGDSRSMMLKGSSTIAAIESSLAARTHTASYIDEITQQSIEHRTALLYMAADGCGKSRSTRTGRPAPTARWVSSVLSTAEHPMQDDGMTQGAQARVLEIRFTPLSPEDITALTQRLNNYGHVVRVWIPKMEKLVQEHGTELRERLWKYLDEGRAIALKARENSRTADTFAEERVTHDALVMSGMAEMLGIPDDQGRGITSLLYGDLHLQGDTASEPEKALRALQSFVIANPAQILSFNDFQSKGPVAARRQESGHLEFERGWLTQFLKKAGFSASNVKQAWARDGTAKVTQLRRGPHRPHFYVIPGDVFDANVGVGVRLTTSVPSSDSDDVDDDKTH